MGLLQKVVKNEAMRNDPPQIYDIGSIGGILVMPTFMKMYGITPKTAANLQSNIVSVLQAGCFFGSLVAYWAADKFGRKPSLMVASGIAIAGIVIQTASDGHISALYVGRLIAGFGVGAASMLTPLYVSENAPRAIRGGLTGIYQLFIATGVMLSFWVNYGTLGNLKGNAQWQVPLALQGLPAVCLFIGILFCNESPRWLARADNWEKATSVLARLRNLPPDHGYVQMELDEMREQLENERALIGGAGFWDLQKEMWLISGNRKRALVSIGLMVCQQMTGTNAINYYAPLIFLNLGIPEAQKGLFATGIYGVVKMVTCAAFLLLAADSLGRRRSLLWTSIAQGLAMFVIGFYVRFNPPVKGQPIPAVGYFALTCIFLFAAFFQFGWGPCCWIIVSEIPTARLRAMNVAIAASTQWLFNFVVAQAVPHMLKNVGKNGYGTYFIFGAFCFSMFFFVWFLVPETKGLSLEKMDDLFGVTDMVKEKNIADEEAHRAPVEIHETTANVPHGDHKNAAAVSHVEHGDKNTREVRL
ncbi:putative Quinate permease [Glarea lozoyensis 74030]|uniref:Putative Quinate permease n=1 Tax=Glarea lozoyensis (strain ATCC 74030 / MF5533) TaxID=1104152 RepID=H0ECF5_GLAL7|nr:putative Quinate permease [Glarea lozoyensis 74030]